VDGARLRAAALDHVWLHSGYAWDEAAEEGGLRVMASGSGCRLTDAEGNEYLDFASGLWLVNAGYGRREIASAMSEQASRLHFTMHRFPAEPTIRLATELARLTPGTLSRVFFTNSGTEANEAAMKIAVQYHRLNGEPSRVKFIGRVSSYHGASFATMGLGGASIDTSPFESLLMPEARMVKGPGHAAWTGLGAGELEEVILREGPETVAAFIGEPVSNSAGVRVPDDDYWPAVREICDRYGILLITDEVITGFGRTGRMFGVEHWGIVPDIMTIAKGLTSGYAPMGAAIARLEIAERFKPGPSEAFQHVVTFGGHAVAAAAALANLRIIEEEGLVARSASLGRYLRAALHDLAEKHRSIIDVRGRGLMHAVELGPREKSGWTAGQRTTIRKYLYGQLLDRGVHLPVTADLAIFMPPLIVTEAEISRAIEAFGEILGDVERGAAWWG
jgi:adenosylmethionine-8-amino-7-oxononanoate aminotransferase